MIQGFSLSGLENVAAGEDSPRRDAILSALTLQYLELEPRLSDSHINLYDNVFRVLVNGIELQARLKLAEKLAPLKRAPREIMRDLANDAYAIVATPVLKHSPLLNEADLVRIASDRSEAHRAAVAQRAHISQTVTDVLVTRREQSVLVALIGNETARLSTDGATTVSDMAMRNTVVAQALGARLQLPAEAVLQILNAARSVVVNTLVQLQPDARARDISDAVSEAVDVLVHLPQKHADNLSEQQIVALYALQSLDEVVAALGTKTGIATDLITEALDAHGNDALLIVLKAAHFTRPHVEAMLSAKMSLPIGSRALVEPLEQFERIRTPDPERTLVCLLRQRPLVRLN